MEENDVIKHEEGKSILEDASEHGQGFPAFKEENPFPSSVEMHKFPFEHVFEQEVGKHKRLL